MVFPRPGTTNISMTHSKDKCLDYIYMYLCTQLQRLFFSSTSNRSLFRGRRQGRQPLNPGAGPGAAARGIAGGLRW